MIPHVLQELFDKYRNVPREEIYDAVEISTIRVMQQLHGTAATAVIGDEQVYVSLLKDNTWLPIDMSKLHRRAKRRLLDEFEIELMKRQACHDAVYFSTIRGSALTGHIEHIRPAGTLIVQFQFNDALNPIEFFAECPVAHQPPHERQNYKVGSYFYFMVNSCLPVSNGRQAKVRIVVSRMARELPSRMLTSLTGQNSIRCTKRIPGGYSRIITKHQIPKTAVNAVGKELRENLQVFCTQHPDKPFTRRTT